MDYDVLILGGGLIGCAVAYELSKYSLNIALIEKDYDIADDVALVNSAIIYDGIQCEDTIMSQLQLMGNSLVKDLAVKFNIPYKIYNSIFMAANEKQQKRIEEIYNRSAKKGIDNIAILSGENIHELEPNLNIGLKMGIYSQNTGVICPYDLGIAYGEVAFDNGVSFKLEEIVEGIKKISKGFKVVTNKNKFTCKMVINTTPEDYNIDGFKESFPESKAYLKYFLLEKSFDLKLNHILFSYNEEVDEIICLHPTVQGNYIASIKTNVNLNYEECYNKIKLLVPEIKKEDINTFYEVPYYDEALLIDDSLVDKGYIKITGKNYAEVTMTPSITKIVKETVENNLKCKKKNDFNDKRREIYSFKFMSNEERKNIISLDKRYGKIVCVCNLVTEGEIVDAIRRPLGARTLEGIKRRTGAALGSCKGAYCVNKIISILARETNKNMTDIVKDSKNSKILLNRIKEFDEI